MNLKAILRSMLGRKPSTTITHTRNRFQPKLELLEDRLAPATFTVNSTLDTDDGLALNATTTLRKAIRLANVDAVADTINFAAALTNQTIILGGTQLPTITKPVTLTGLGSDKLTIDANNTSRIFNINDGTAAKIAVSISGLRLTRGQADNGAGINNTEALTLATSTLDHNAALLGGGIYNNSGTLTLTDSTLTANSASNSGGGIVNANNGIVTLTNSTLAANTATNGNGGGIYHSSGTLTLTNSTLSGNSAKNGGGIFINSGMVTVTNSTALSGNSASNGGGGIYHASGTLTLTNSTLSGNTAKYGGGIYHGSGTLTLTNSTLSGNGAKNGGGIFINYGMVTVTNSTTLSGNYATDGGGGGIYNSSGTLTLTNSTLSANKALGDSIGIGGGICNGSGTVTVSYSTLSANYVENGDGIGGGIYNSSGMVTVSNSTLSANYVYTSTGGSTVGGDGGGDGGGIYNTGTVTVSNSTLSGNRAEGNSRNIINGIPPMGLGGGIYNSGTLTLTNATLANNFANAYSNFYITGGAIFHASGVAKLFNTIVAGNGNHIAGNNVDSTSAFNLIGNPNSSGGMSNGVNGNIVGKNGGTAVLPLAEILDPTLRDNGGPTLTHALSPFSAATDAGDNARVATIPFDQRGPGFNRIISARVDIGAFEMPRPIFSDLFQRAQGPSLGPPWVNQSGALGIVGVNPSHAQGAVAGERNIATVAGLSAADVDLYATVNVGTSQQAGLIARYGGAGPTNYYLANLRKDADGFTTARIMRNVDGAITDLDVVDNVASSGLLRFRVVGSTLQLFLGGALLTSVEDTTFKSGSVGLRTIGLAAVANFKAWPVSTPLDTIDPFTHPDGTKLSDPWTNAVGFFSTLDNKIHGGEALNLAVLNGVNQPDVDVQASVSFTGLNHTAGLLARYQGNGDANYYLGKLTRTSTGFTATLLKNVAGVVTTLTTANITSATGTANLRFLVTGDNLKFFVNNIRVANFLDTSLASGSVGIRADQYATLDDFHAAAVTTDLPFADNFDQPNGASLGINWTRRIGDFNVQGNNAVGVNPGPAVNLATLVGVNQANVEVQADVALATTGHEIGLLACQSGTTDANYYMARVLKTAAGFTLSIVKNVGGTLTLLTSINAAALTGPIKFRIEGVSLKLFMNNVLQLSTTDSSLAAGSVGIRSIGTGTIDNFAAAAVNFLPFNDSFDADTLNANWSSRAGGYTTTAVADKAKGTAALNLMTLRRFPATEVDVQARVNVLAGAGQFASLFARYSGPADNNMYMASISYNGTQYVASIQKKVGGVTTTLASVNVAGGIGTLRFTAIGGQLKLYFTGTELLTAYDFTLKTGSVGIRSTLDPTFDNFSAKQAS